MIFRFLNDSNNEITSENNNNNKYKAIFKVA